jgi:hypothetical protein
MGLEVISWRYSSRGGDRGRGGWYWQSYVTQHIDDYYVPKDKT